MVLILAMAAFTSCSPISSETGSDIHSQTISPATPKAEEPIDESIVMITDPLLEALVHAAMGRSEGFISQIEAEGVIYLNLNNQWHKELYPDQKILNLQGLEYFKNLKSLDLSDHEISDVAVIGNLTDLEELNLSGNPISDISPLSSLKSLKMLVLSECMAEDYAPLSNLDNLEILVLNNASISDVAVLSPLKNLKQLYLAGSQISNYFPLAEIYPYLEIKDFTLKRSLEGLGFHLDNENQAIFDSESASIRINHLEWGQPHDEWMNNSVRTVFSSDNAKIDIGYYPNFDTFVMMAFVDGEMALNYLYNRSDESLGLGMVTETAQKKSCLKSSQMKKYSTIFY
ncbi:MAG: leucine-rich repeat domain-containing protein [Porphyromonadaceae bacterium]|nr:leucine-rich repeat domain-containing protein [Porphyromonadaceae bacterium]